MNENYDNVEVSTEMLLEILRDINRYNGAYEGDELYYMDELDELFQDFLPSRLLLMVGDNFNVYHDYFRIDGYGHLISMNSWELDEYLEMLKSDILNELIELLEDGSFTSGLDNRTLSDYEDIFLT